MKAYEYIAKMWKEYGVSHVFLQDVMFMESLKKFRELGGTEILAHSEFAAGYMADGYARVSGKPGIACSQSIGSANLAASIQDAWLACTPVITYTGRQIVDNLYRNAYQEGDHRPFFDGLTKFNATVEDPKQLPLLMRQTFRESTTGKPRPSHLDIVGFCGLECEEGEVNEEAFATEAFKQFPAFRMAAEAEAIEIAVEAISQAKKPLILAGRGALMSGAHAEILEFATKNDIPVCTTPDGKSIIDETSDIWAGVIGNYGMYGANRTARACDLYIVIGSQTSNQTTLGYTSPPPSVKTIQIDIEPSEIGRNYPNCIALAGDAKTVVAQLIEGTTKTTRKEWRAEVAGYVKATLDRHNEIVTDDSNPITPGYLVGQISEALPEDAVVVVDTGFSTVWTANLLRLKPSQMYIRATGTLGWSFPGSIGVKCAVGDRPVLNFSGDGAFFYFSNEIETAVRYNIPIVSVVNNNGCLSSNLPWMKEILDEDCNNSRNSFVPTQSYAAIAREFGANGIRVEKSEDIAGAIKEGFASGRPTVIEVVTTNTVNPPCPNTDDPANIDALIAKVK